jgi:hypothetical protein
MPQPNTTKRSRRGRQGGQQSSGVLLAGVRQSTAVLLQAFADKVGHGPYQGSSNDRQGDGPRRGERQRSGRQQQGHHGRRGTQSRGRKGHQIDEIGGVTRGRWGVRAQQRPPLAIDEGHLLLVFEQFRAKLIAETPIGYLAIMHWTGQHSQSATPTAYYVERGRNTARILKTICLPTLSVLEDAREALHDAEFATTEHGRLTYEAVYWDLMYLCQVHGLTLVPGFGSIPAVETIARNLKRIADNFERVDSSVRQALMCRAPLADCYQQLHRFSEARQEMLTVFALLGRNSQFRDIGQITAETEPELAEAVSSGNGRTAPQAHRARQPA